MDYLFAIFVALVISSKSFWKRFVEGIIDGLKK